MPQPARIEENADQAAHRSFREAVALFEAGKLAEAAEAFREALRHDINYASAWANLGTVLRKLGHIEASAACSERALTISPNTPSYLTNYGNCLVDLGRMDEALTAHAAATRHKPGDFLIRHNYSVALREAGRFKEALALFDALLQEQPQNMGIQWDAALTRLQSGDFKNGWEAFEMRWKLPNMRERQSKTAKRWRGEDLKGKTILVYDEQGFGDSILCSRYIPLLRARGARIILECKRELHCLFSTLPGVVGIGQAGDFMTGFDYHVPMMSLPGIFGTDLSNIPSPASLHAAPSLSSGVAQLLGQGNGLFKVGIVWSGSATFVNNHKRAVDATRFLSLAAIPGVQLYSLQKGPLESDLKKSGTESLILPLGPHVNDFSETAAVVKELDLVIMTDSSVAHLAGSLGVPVWNLLCYRPYWLYLTGRDDTPWYPSMRLFRQPKAGDWDSVFAEVARELRKTAAAQVAPARVKKRA